MDDSSNFHRIALKKYPALSYHMNRDFQHSIYNVEAGGGRIQDKLVAEVDGLHKPITDIRGKTTTLREFILGLKDPETERPFFIGVTTSPTIGNAASILTTFTSYRSANERRTMDMAQKAQEMVNEIPRILWKHFDEETITKILSPVKCQKMHMRNALTPEDIPELNKIFEIENIEIEILAEEEEASLLSAYQDSVNTPLTNDTQITTQSTKLRLQDQIEENETLQNQNETIKRQYETLKNDMAKLQEEFKNLETKQNADDKNSGENPETTEQEEEKNTQTKETHENPTQSNNQTNNKQKHRATRDNTSALGGS